MKYQRQRERARVCHVIAIIAELQATEASCMHKKITYFFILNMLT